MSKAPDAESPTPEPHVKVVDRRWWARGDADASVDEQGSSKPTYVEELEQRLAEKDRLLQGYVEQYKNASAEFEQARARARREMARDLERGRRAVFVDLLDVLDNLDRAIDAATPAGAPSSDALLAGVRLVRDQFRSRLEANGITEIAALGERFDPAVHEAVSTVPATADIPDDYVAGVIRRGYRMGDEVLRPALVAVAKQ